MQVEVVVLLSNLRAIHVSLVNILSARRADQMFLVLAAHGVLPKHLREGTQSEAQP